MNNIISNKKDYITRLTSIETILQSENNLQTKNFQQNEKYIKYIKWLKDNGAVFEDTLDYPIAYGPSGLVGVKAKRQIENNEAILYIPKRLMIISKDHESKYFINLKKDQTKESKDEDNDTSIIDEDNSSINLTIFLIEQKYEEGNNSFYKPYLDLFPEQDFSVFWSEKRFNELDCISLINSIKILRQEMINEYELLDLNFKKKYNVETFMLFYSHVLSRQFYINDETSALIPMADALNHSSVKIKYEIFDSDNYICKYTEHFSHFKHLQPTSCNIFYQFINKQTNSNLNKAYILKNTNDTDVLLDDSDYFIISTNLQRYETNSQVFNNYGSWPNKSFLKYYCFSLINNKYDYTLISISYKKGNTVFDSNMKIVFPKGLVITEGGEDDILKIKIRKKKICKRLLRYYRFLYFFDNKEVNKNFFYCFDYSIEYCILKRSIELLRTTFDKQNMLHSIDSDIDILEKEIVNINYDSSYFNSVIFRLTQKINLIYQIELLNAVFQLMQRHKPKTYFELIEYISEIDQISQYETNQNSIGKIVSFLVNP